MKAVKTVMIGAWRLIQFLLVIGGLILLISEAPGDSRQTANWIMGLLMWLVAMGPEAIKSALDRD